MNAKLKFVATNALKNIRTDPQILIELLDESSRAHADVATGKTSWFSSNQTDKFSEIITLVEGELISKWSNNPTLTKELQAAKAKFKILNGEISKVLVEEWNALFSSRSYAAFENAIKSKVLKANTPFYPIIKRLLQYKYMNSQNQTSTMSREQMDNILREKTKYSLLTGELQLRNAQIKDIPFTAEEKQRLKTIILEEQNKNRGYEDLRPFAVHTGESPEYLHQSEGVAESKRLASQKCSYNAWVGGNKRNRQSQIKRKKRKTAKRRTRK